jgi:aryl-alcohol dehydrogenase-like predicted oxidoreductase
MEYRRLGRTGVRVSDLCLGTLSLSRATPGEARALLAAASDAGINFVDTANRYGAGRAEELLGAAIRPFRDQVVLATKAGLAAGDGPNDRGAGRRHLIGECDRSLRRLGTDWIDLYQVHAPDPSTPIEESLRALDDLVRAGKVRYVGLSSFPAWQAVEALWAADRLRLASAPVAEQPPYNLLDRRAETDVLPMARRHELAILPWSPLSGGLLTGKYGDGRTPDPGHRYAAMLGGGDARGGPIAAALGTVQRLAEVAAGAGLTLPQLAMAWLRDRPEVTAPVIGPRDPAQLATYVAAREVRLDQATRDAVDAVVPPGTAVRRLTR